MSPTRTLKYFIRRKTKGIRGINTPFLPMVRISLVGLIKLKIKGKPLRLQATTWRDSIFSRLGKRRHR